MLRAKFGFDLVLKFSEATDVGSAAENLARELAGKLKELVEAGAYFTFAPTVLHSRGRHDGRTALRHVTNSA